MSQAPALHSHVRISRVNHFGIVTAVYPKVREARVSAWPHDVPWTALEYC